MNRLLAPSCVLLLTSGLASCESLIIDFKSPTYGAIVRANTTTVVFDVLGASGAVTNECWIDDRAKEPCVSGHRFSDLSEGYHFIHVASRDASGKTGEARVRVTITHPKVVFTKPWPSSVWKTNVIPIEFALADGPAPGVSYTCRLNDTTEFPCTTGQSLKVPDGLHTLVVSASGDGVPNSSDRVVFFVEGGTLPRRLSARQLSTGSGHACAVLEDGTVRCWGHNESGQLGIGSRETVGDDEVPAQVNGPAVDDVIEVSAGGQHTCVRRSRGEVVCWGRGQYGQLGYGDTQSVGDDERPLPSRVLAVAAAQISAGREHTCVRTAWGTVSCWGRGGSGRLGYGNTNDVGDDEVPGSAGEVEIGGAVTQVAAGGDHSCALLADGSVRCWGSNGRGQLGRTDPSSVGDDEAPASVAPVVLPVPAIQVAVSEVTSCALHGDGRVSCWGAGVFTPRVMQPVILNVSPTAISLGSWGLIPAVGGEQLCWDTSDGFAGCTTFSGERIRAVRASAGNGYACFLTASGSVRCRGSLPALVGHGPTNALRPPNLETDIILALSGS